MGLTDKVLELACAAPEVELGSAAAPCASQALLCAFVAAYTILQISEYCNTEAEENHTFLFASCPVVDAER